MSKVNTTARRYIRQYTREKMNKFRNTFKFIIQSYDVDKGLTYYTHFKYISSIGRFFWPPQSSWQQFDQVSWQQQGNGNAYLHQLVPSSYLRLNS